MTPDKTTDGLCATCIHTRIIRSERGSRFLRCGLSDEDPRFPKYPRLPVLTCDGWQKKLDSDAGSPLQ
jgi:hypothetical protein